MKLINRSLLTLITLTTLVVGCDTLGIKKPEQTNAPATTGGEPVAHEQALAQEPVVQVRTYDTVWDRIRAGYSLPSASNNTVDTQIRFYTNNKSYFYRVTQESEPYLYYVANEMQANGMPMELALLPFIESSYNPLAASPGNQNVGMWQFGAATGKNFGLDRNNWYDGRKDVVASTDAAIRLLKKLYARFDNDWLVAVAAYNAGDGNIQQAIDKNRRAGKPTDFWSLPLNKTTQGYIPQLLALSKIVANPEAYNFKLHPIPDVPYFVKVNVGSQINLADAAKKSSLDVALLKRLNAGFNGWLTDPNKPRDLLVPVDAAASFRLELDSLPKVANIKWQEHLVKKGDNLDAIAKKYGANVARIKTVNNLKNANVTPGQRLQIPLTNDSTPVAETNTNNTTEIADVNPAQPAKSNSHVVQSGESLWSIAKANGTSVAELAKLNNINAQGALKPGQKLVTSNQVATNNNQEKTKLRYTIKAGDTLGQIAAKYDISVKQIMEWNKIADETNIRPDQELVMADPKN